MRNQTLRLVAITALAFFSLSGVGILALDSSSAQEEENRPNILERVAEILGIQEEQLQDAFTTAASEGIDERVEAGQLDEEKAAEMKERLEENGFQFGPKHGKRGHKQHSPEHEEAVAEFLGISIEELEQAKEEEKRMPELLEEAGKTEEELKAFMQERFGDERPEGREGEADRPQEEQE